MYLGPTEADRKRRSLALREPMLSPLYQGGRMADLGLPHRAQSAWASVNTVSADRTLILPRYGTSPGAGPLPGAGV